jgi:hypothetical protein
LIDSIDGVALIDSVDGVALIGSIGSIALIDSVDGVALIGFVGSIALIDSIDGAALFDSVEGMHIYALPCGSLWRVAKDMHSRGVEFDRVNAECSTRNGRPVHEM